MISVLGDVFLGKNKFSIHPKVNSFINSSEFCLMNFESVVCDYNQGQFSRVDKKSILNSSYTNVSKLRSLIKPSILFSLSNNHLHDLSEEGVDKTIQALKSFDNCQIIGGATEEKKIPYYEFRINGKRLIVISVTTSNPEVMSKTACKPFYLFDYQDYELNNFIRNIKAQCDYILIYPHWGIEYLDIPSYEQRQIAYSWIDSGADLVIGHHPHVTQGKEMYGGKYIYYSLGNTIFPSFHYKDGTLHKWKRKNNESIILKLRFLNQGIEIEELGCEFSLIQNTLSPSESALQNFYAKSEMLDYAKTSKKSYYMLFQKFYFNHLKTKEFGNAAKIKKLFPKHKEHGVIVYFLLRIIRKITR